MNEHKFTNLPDMSGNDVSSKCAMEPGDQYGEPQCDFIIIELTAFTGVMERITFKNLAQLKEFRNHIDSYIEQLEELS